MSLPVLVLASAGAAAGIIAKVADESGVRWMSDAGTLPALWALTLTVIAALAPDALRAALRSVAFFTSACLAYYLWQAYVLNFGAGKVTYLWLALSVTVVPALAALLWWAVRRRGVWGALVLAGVGGFVLANGSVIQVWWYLTSTLPEEFPLRPVQAAFDLVVALVVVTLLPRHHATRSWAALLLVPTAWLIDTVGSAVPF